jgi:hypothetical protein
MVVFLNRDLQKPLGYKVDPTMYDLVIMKCHYVLESIEGYMRTGDRVVACGQRSAVYELETTKCT